VRPDGTGERLLAARAGNARWSPDGRRLAFHRTVDPSEYVNDRPCTVRTHLIDRDGRNEQELPDLGDGCPAPPLWSPDGTRLASVLITPQGPGQDPLWSLAVVMVDGSRPPLILGDRWGSWQPVAAPLPPAPSFAPASSAP
jgi:dipeptidyl aminopeptidase/acylaminoacyl peptidase